jgi:site-specific recombinase XerD
VPRSSSQSIDRLRVGFRAYLRASHRSERTIQAYDDAAKKLSLFLGHKPLADITTTDIEGFMKHRLTVVKPSSVKVQFKSLQAFFRWAHRYDNSISVDPMAPMSPPRAPIRVTHVLTEDEKDNLLRACNGREFADYRDKALTILFMETGARLQELTRLTLGDVDLVAEEIRVIGKGDRVRRLPMSSKATGIVDKYIREREGHPNAGSERLWLGKAGVMTESGVGNAIRNRGKSVGITVHPHMYRHTFASTMLANGMSEGNVMTIGGWRSRSMIDHYGRETAEQRAFNAYRTMMNRR